MTFQDLKFSKNNVNKIEDDFPIVGIDLGTTNSLVATVTDGFPFVLKSALGDSMLPSVVFFSSQEMPPLIGQSAKAKKLTDAKNTVFSIKRLLGRNIEDLKENSFQLPYRIVPGDGGVQVEVNGKSYSVIEISSMILKELKLQAEVALGKPVKRAVITVPAYFNDSQRQATRAAGRIAGLDVLRIVNEPTAAALAYGLHQKKEGLIAVYDLGGGTFDISILKLKNGIFEVLSTHGDTALGGDDLDQALVQYIADKFQKNLGIDYLSDLQKRVLLTEVAEKAKISFSEKSEVLIDINSFKFILTLSEFNEISKPVLEHTRAPCLQAMQDASIKPEDLTDVVLVGGPTRLSVIQDFVQEIFKRKPNTSEHPDEVVALGAAIQADILAGKNRDILLLDVIPLSLGIETYGGLMSPIIPRNTRIPAVAREIFTTFVSNQTAVDIHVLQGDRERVEDNRSLGRFKLTGIPHLPAGMPRIEVTFLIDADGVLQVTAKDIHTGREQIVEVKPSYGMTEEEINRMLRASQEHAAKDVEYRKFVEARNEAERVLKNTEKNLPKALGHLSDPEIQKINESLERVKKSIQTNQANEVRGATDQLNQATIVLAEFLIKNAILEAQCSKKEERQ